MSSPLFFLLLLFPDLEKTQLVPKWMFISFSQGNKKLNTDILLERKIFHLTSEKHLQVAAGKAKEIQSLFAAITTPLPAAQGRETSSAWKAPDDFHPPRAGPGWAAPAASLGARHAARGGNEEATEQKSRLVSQFQAMTDSEL